MNYKSNLNRVITNLKKSLISIEALDKLTLEVAAGVMASNLRRIHNEGKNVNDSSIGKYSTKSIYVNPANSPRRFATAGKNSNKSKFKNGKQRKTKYFKDGYKGFRAEIGRETGYVNLQLTGSLKADFNIQKSNNGYSIGFSKKAKIADGLESHFNTTIWGLSNRDKRIANEIVSNFVNKRK
jgi:hypothetical protein